MYFIVYDYFTHHLCLCIVFIAQAVSPKFVTALKAGDNLFNTFMPGKFLTSVVWTFVTYEKYFGMNHKFSTYKKESCVLDYSQHFSFKYSLKLLLLQSYI